MKRNYLVAVAFLLLISFALRPMHENPPFISDSSILSLVEYADISEEEEAGSFIVKKRKKVVDDSGNDKPIEQDDEYFAYINQLLAKYE